MIQRIAVRLILEYKGRPLLLRRADGRPSILRKYELPGGRVLEGEQPEDALERCLREDLGLIIPLPLELTDVFTYHDIDDRDIQYAVILFASSIDYVERIFTLSGRYDKYIWYDESKIDIDDITDLSQTILKIQSPGILSSGRVKYPIVYSDGGSRGNPGLSAAGFVLVDRNGNIVDQGSQFLGVATNDVAEYQGLKLGLSAALRRGWQDIECRLDSTLVVDQMNGIHKPKDVIISGLYDDVCQLVNQFHKVRFRHVAREVNTLADGMVNKCLDDHQSSGV